ncbi:MAG: N-acetylmuramoyl-L-alanine amidase [Candidatus Paceibacterota bacterium]
MKRMYIFLIGITAAVSIAGILLDRFTTRSLASFSTLTPTVAELQQKYIQASANGSRVRILIVPGHEPNFGGAEYQNIYERNITVGIADQLALYLKQNPKLEIIVARSNTDWNITLADYFTTQWSAIQSFIDSKKESMEKAVTNGSILQRSLNDQVDHHAAPANVALRLYGINKWVNENNIDLVIHLHINDTTDHGLNEPSANSGFAVYVPDTQYGNASTSLPIGKAIAQRLAAMNATSSLPVENKGVVEDQELIAIGASDTLSVPSVLVEYSYITEPKFAHSELLATVTKDFAYETYLGLQDFFKDSVASKYPTASLPFRFSGTPALGTASSAVYSLQAGLHTLGYYPAASSTFAASLAKIQKTSSSTPTLFNECEISGVMDACTRDAISAFQKSRGWKSTGKLGPMTITALNKVFGV